MKIYKNILEYKYNLINCCFVFNFSRRFVFVFFSCFVWLFLAFCWPFWYFFWLFCNLFEFFLGFSRFLWLFCVFFWLFWPCLSFFGPTLFCYRFANLMPKEINQSIHKHDAQRNEPIPIPCPVSLCDQIWSEPITGAQAEVSYQSICFSKDV